MRLARFQALALLVLTALTVVDALDLGGYYLYHAIRADLLRRLHRNTEAAQSYDAAISLADNTTERDFLQRMRQAISAR